MNELLALILVVGAIVATAVTAWILRRYDLLRPTQRRSDRWYLTWRRTAALAPFALFAGVLTQLTYDWRGPFLLFFVGLTAVLFYPRSGVSFRALQVEQFILWLLCLGGGLLLGRNPEIWFVLPASYAVSAFVLGIAWALGMADIKESD